MSYSNLPRVRGRAEPGLEHRSGGWVGVRVPIHNHNEP